MKAIQMEHITKVYEGKKALDDISLEVEEGSVFGFIGPNGAGKTTTIKLLMNMIQPTSGMISILGKQLKPLDYTYLQHIGFVPEENNLYEAMTLSELLSFNKGLYTTWNQPFVKKYLDYFELPTHQKMNTFSKGMRVKSSLILAMAHDPKLLILDEPTSGLDPIFRRDFLRVLLDEMVLEGKTIFFSSHIIDDVERIADTVGIINKGKLVRVKAMEEIKVNEKKLRIVFQTEVSPDFFQQPGIEHVEIKGNAHIITISENFEDIYYKCKEQPHFALEIVEQSLEDILINTSGR